MNKRKTNDIYFNWDHSNEYYIKTDKKLQNRYFALTKNFIIHFKFAEVDQQINNNKIGMRFVILDSIASSDNLIICFFDFKCDSKYLKQKEYNEKSLKWIMEYIQTNFSNLYNKKHESTIKKKLTNFTNIKNQCHFIHKDLKGFLNQELDDYVKEMLHRDLLKTP
jgi:adenine-specific DNA-methyltransferase